MVGTNKTYSEIVKRIFGANNGKQLQLLRQKIEVIEFLNYCKENNIKPNTTQQKHIDKVNTEYNKYDNLIHTYLGTIPIKDMEEVRQ